MAADATATTLTTTTSVETQAGVRLLAFMSCTAARYQASPCLRWRIGHMTRESPPHGSIAGSPLLPSASEISPV